MYGKTIENNLSRLYRSMVWPIGLKSKQTEKQKWENEDIAYVMLVLKFK